MRRLAAVLAVILALPLAAQPVYPAPGRAEPVPRDLPWYFVAVFGDNRPADTSSTRFPPVFYRIVREISLANPFAVIGTGDHTGEGSREQIDAFLDAVANLSNVWVIEGNHDIGFPEDLQYWREKVAPRMYYRDDIPGWRIVFVSTEPVTRRIVEFLDEALDTSRAKIVVMHRPLYPYVGHNLARVYAGLLEPVIEEHGVSIVLQGHWHGYAEEEVNGTLYIITGGAGAPLYSAEAGFSVNHYLYLVLYPNSTYRVIPVSTRGTLRVYRVNETAFIVENTKLDPGGNPTPIPVRLGFEEENVTVVLMAPPGHTLVALTGSPGSPVHVNATTPYYYYGGPAWMDRGPGEVTNNTEGPVGGTSQGSPRRGAGLDVSWLLAGLAVLAAAAVLIRGARRGILL